MAPNVHPLASIPFCGTPPLPAEIWQRWVLDPVLLALLAMLLVAGWLAMRRSAGRGPRAAFLGAWGLASAALVSPLCALSVALFSARATQHMVLLVIAAPLLALALPDLLGSHLHDRVQRWLAPPVRALLPALAFAVLLWAWHVPVLYDATFTSDLAYWAMHLSLLATALPLWLQLLQPGQAGLLPRMLLGFATFMQMGLLGALLTLSPSLLYEAHVTTTLAWGMDPLADQQLGGLIMWIPGCSSLLLALLWSLVRTLREPGELRERAAEPAISRR